VIGEGVFEIWLTSEVCIVMRRSVLYMPQVFLIIKDTGAYGRDIGVTLPQLLWQIVAVLPEGVMLRLGMTNPPYILEHLEVRRESIAF